MPMRRQVRGSSRRQLSRTSQRRIDLGVVEVLESRIMLSTNTWNGANADWNTPGDWSLSRVPNSADIVVINSGTVTVSTADTAGTLMTGTAASLVINNNTLTLNGAGTIAGSLTVSGGTLNILSNPVTAAAVNFTSGTITGTAGGAMVINGLLTWSGGFMGDPATTANGGINFSGSTNLFLSGGTLTNASGQSATIGTGGAAVLQMQNGATFVNAGTFTGSGGAAFSYNGGGSVVNTGAFDATGPFTIGSNIPLANSGTVEVKTGGTLTLAGGGTGTSGTYQADSGATLIFNGGAQTLDSGSSIDGSGTLSFVGGTITDTGIFNVTGLTTISAATLNLDDSASASIVNLSGGNIGGTGNFAIGGLFTWSGGLLSEASTSANGGINFTGNSDLFLNGGTLTNSAGQSATIGASGTTALELENNGTFANAGTLTASGGAGIFYNGGGTVNNIGTFDVTGQFILGSSITMTSSGTLEVKTGGTLTLASSTTNTGTASFLVDAGATLLIDGGTQNFSAGTNFNVAGTFSQISGTVNENGTFAVTGPTSVSGGTLNLNDSAAVNSLNLSGGLVGGTGNLAIGGLFTWSAGTVSEASTSANGGINFAGNGSNGEPFLNGGTLTNSAGQSATIGAGGDIVLELENNGTFANAGTLTASGGSGIFYNGGGTVSNSGTFDVIGQFILGSNVTMTNSGTLEVKTGGTLTLASSTTSTGTASFLVDSGASLLIDAGTQNFNAGSNFNVAGTFSLTGGVVNTNGTFAVTGPTSVSNGTLNLNDSATVNALNFSGGLIGGTGNLAIGGLFTWSSGTLSELSASANGGINFAGNGSNGEPFINGGTLTNPAGQSATIGAGGDVVLELENNGTFANAGTLTASGGAGIFYNGGGTVSNSGTFDVTGQFILGGSIAVANSGTLEVKSGGSLTLASSTTNTATASFLVDSGASFLVNGGTQNFNAGSNFNVAGTFSLTSGVVNTNGTFTVTGPTSVSNGTLNVNDAASVGIVSFTGGAIGGAGNLAIGGLFTWSGGMFSTAQATANAGIVFAGNEFDFLSGGTLINAAGQSATIGTGGGVDLEIENGGTFTNAGTLTTSGTSAAIVYNGGAGVAFDNSGTFDINGILSIDSVLPLINSGTVEVKSGALADNGGGASSGTANYIADSGATLSFGGGVQTFVNGTTLSGAGTIALTGANVSFAGTVSSTASDLAFSAGITAGTGSLMIGGVLTWSGGEISNALTTANGGIDFVGNGDSFAFLSGGTLINNGQNSTIGASGGIFVELENGGTFVNVGTLTASGSGAEFVYNGGAGVEFNNTGTFDINGIFSINSVLPLINSGTVEVKSGALTDYGGGASSGTANYIADSGATLSFGGGVQAFVNGTMLSGAGTIALAGANVSFAGTVSSTASDLAFSAGITAGTGSLMIGGVLTWSGGEISNALTTANGGINFVGNGDSFDYLSGGTLINNGQNSTIGASGGIFVELENGGTFVNAGTLTASGSGAEFVYNGGAGVEFNNTGTFDSTGQFTISGNVLVNNTGTVEAGGGTLSIPFNDVAQISGANLTGGTWVAVGTLAISGATLTSSQANISLVGPTSSFSAINGITSNTGSFTVTGGRLFTTTTNGFSNSGTVTIGAGSVLAVQGAFKQFAQATLATQIGGTPASGSYGLLAVFGTATLAGTLAASLVNNFTPLSNSYTLATFPAEVSIFSAYSLPTVNGTTFTPTINPTSVVLSVNVTQYPTSSVTALPSTEASPNFMVAWSGQPYSGGPPIQDYSVYDSDDGGPFTIFVNQSPSTSATFNGKYGHTYGFYSVATDTAGNVQPTPTGAQAMASVVPPTISVTPTGFSPTAARAFTGQVASFTDSDPSVTNPGVFSAMVTWGNGVVNSGTITSGTGGTFLVSGTNTYNTSGSYTLSVTINDGFGDIGANSESISVTPAPLSVVSAASLSTTAGFTLSNVQLATFADAGGVEPASFYSATINWNDGTATTAGLVSIVSGQIVVSGTHVYQLDGSYQPSITLSDPASQAMANPTIAVADPLSISATSISPVQGRTFTGNVASVTDSNPLETSGQLHATITWGDGDVTSGSISGSNGSFIVSGTDTYPTTNSYMLSVQVTDAAGNTATSGSEAVTPISGALTVVSAASVNGTQGFALNNVSLATFADAGGIQAAGAYVATINWGDGTGNISGAVNIVSGQVVVSGSHTYNTDGTENVSVTLTDSSSSVTAHPTIAVAPVPDLTPQNFTAPPSSQFGQSVMVSWTDQNIGDGNANGSWTDEIYLSTTTSVNFASIPLLSRPVNSTTLAPGAGINESATVTLPAPTANLAPGSYYLIVDTDLNNTVGEANIANNTSASAIQVAEPPLPNLQVTSIGFSPTNVQSGQSLTVNWDDSNTGGAAASGNWYDLITVTNTTTNQTLLSTVQFESTNNIAAGSQSPRSFTFALPNGTAGVGNINVLITADYYNNVFEYNGSSKTSSASTVSTLAAYPDLQVKSLNVSPASGLLSGAVMSVSWQDANTGVGPVNGAFVDELTIVNSTTGQTLLNTSLTYNEASSGPIAPGGAANESYEFQLPNGVAGVGQIQTTVTVNYTNSVFEYNTAGTATTNNTSSVTTSSALAAYPVLAVSDVTGPQTANPGHMTAVDWTLSNVGNATALGSWTEQVFMATDAQGDNETLLTSQTFNGPLAANAQTLRSALVGIPSTTTGSVYFVVVENPFGQLFEANTSSNTGISTQPTVIPNALSVSLASHTESNGAGASATTATVTRNGDTSSALVVNLTSSDPAEVTVPATVTIAAGQTSATFTVGTINDGAVEPSQVVTITASATGQVSGSDVLELTNINTPTLTVSLPTSFEDNATNPAGFGTVTTNDPSANPLTVNLSSDDTLKLTLPATVTIPAGQTSATFALTAVNDNQIDGDANVTVTASASGFTNGTAEVDVLDANIPVMNLSLAPAIVSQNGGSGATTGTITLPGPAARQIVIDLASNDTGVATVPSQVVIVAGQTSVNFPVNAINNGLDIGNQTAQITANYVSEGGVELPNNAATATLTVVNANGPALSITIPVSAISASSSTTATITRNTSTTSALVVTLSSSDTTHATVPATVTIPTGQASATFTITGVDDMKGDGEQYSQISATASGFAEGLADIDVTTVDLPDLTVANVTAPPAAASASTVQISWTVLNNGLYPADGSWADSIYLDALNGSPGGGLYAQVAFNGAVAAGQTYTQTFPVTLPSDVGQYNVRIVTNSDNFLEELNTNNNTGVAPEPITVSAPYTASVSTSITAPVPNGTPIPLSGQAISTSTGRPAAGVPVSVWVLVDGTARQLTATTDANGNYSLTFQPLSDEVGSYTAVAAYPGLTSEQAEALVPAGGNDVTQFTIIGITATPATGGSVKIVPQTPLSGQFILSNLGATPMTGIIAVSEDAPSDVTVQLTAPSTLGPNAIGTLMYTLTATGTSAESGAIDFHITSAQGAVLDIPIAFTVVPLNPQLAANPGFLDAGMVVGSQSSESITITNNGGAPSGAITVELPSVSYLSLSSSATIASLAPGASTTVTVLLTPDASLALGQYTGNIVLAYSGTGLSVPFTFTATTTATGTVQVLADDDFTFTAAGEPRVAGATVQLLDPYDNSQVIATGTTDSTGQLTLPNIPAGPYLLQVSAPGHSTYDATYTVNAGVTNTAEVFLDNQLVTYTWQVVPTEIQDQYTIQLETTFETDVPAPVVTITGPPSVPVLAAGQSTQIDFLIANHGLIAAQDFQLTLPTDPEYTFTALGQQGQNVPVGNIPANSTVDVPVMVTFNPISSDDSIGGGGNGTITQQLLPCTVDFPGLYFFTCDDVQHFLTPATTLHLPNRVCNPATTMSNFTQSMITEGGGAGGGSGGGSGGTPTTGGGGGTTTAPPELEEPEETGPRVITPVNCNACLAELGAAALQVAWNLYPPTAFVNSLVGYNEALNSFEMQLDEIGALTGLGDSPEGEEGEPTPTEVSVGKTILNYLSGGLDDLGKAASGAGKTKLGGALGVLSQIASVISDNYDNILNSCLGITGSSGLGLKPGELPPFGTTGITQEEGQVELAIKLLESQTGDNATLDADLATIETDLQNLETLTMPIQLLLGSYDWITTDQPTVAEEWLAAFAADTNDTTDGSIDQADQTQLLATTLPDGVTQADALTLIQNWNQTITYYSEGIFTASQIPAGQPTNFIDFLQLISLTSSAQQAILTSQADGYTDPETQLHAAVNQFINDINDSNVCAEVTLQLDQTATLTRSAFDGTLTIDNMETGPLTNVQVTLNITDANGNPANAMLFTEAPVVSGGLTAVDGTGMLPSGDSGTVNYTFIPADTAAPDGPTQYSIGGTISYIAPGTDYAVSIPIYPATITVYPQASLNLSYFLQRDVIGEDPSNPQENIPSEPAVLGLLVTNAGLGEAQNLSITTAQPQIVENEKGLLDTFQIIGTQVGTSQFTPSLTVDLGNIESGQTADADFLLTSTLQGVFEGFTASFQHTNSLGGLETSLINSVQAYDLVHAGDFDFAGSTGEMDYLADVNPNPENNPDTIFFSDGTTAPVNDATDATASGTISATNPTVTVTADVTSGWDYIDLPDPGAGYTLYKVVRSDGTAIPVSDQAWQTDRTFTPAGKSTVDYELHILDDNSTGSYTLYYKPTNATAPMITAIQSISNPQIAPVGSVQVTFNEPIDPATLVDSNISLTLDGGPNLINSNVMITQNSPTMFTIGNLSGLTAGPGNYTLSVSAAGVTDYFADAGTGSTSESWANANGAPVIVSVGAGSPALRNTPVGSVIVDLSEPIVPSSFTTQAVTLTLNGGSNLINSGVTIVQDSSTQYEIDGLQSLTTTPGIYLLTVAAAGLLDPSNHSGVGIASDAWTLDTTPPTISSLGPTPQSPRNIVVPYVDVTFSKPINPSSFTYQAIDFAQSGGQNLILPSITITQLSSTEYQVSNFENLIAPIDGNYTFTVNAADVSDLAGNSGVGTASLTWDLQTASLSAPTNLAITPNTGNTAGLTNVQDVTLTGTVGEAGLTVDILDGTTDLGDATVNGASFTDALTLPLGENALNVYAVDSAGNVSPATSFTVTVDNSPPELAVTQAPPADSSVATNSVQISFSKPVNIGNFDDQDLTLTRNGGPNLIDSGVTITSAGGNLYAISGLGTLDAPDGEYVLTINDSTVTDNAGNAGTGVTTVMWTVTDSPLDGITDTWMGGVSDDWNNPANWSTGAVPTASDTAAIDSGSVVADNGIDVAALYLFGGMLSITGGNISGSLNVSADATLSVTDSASTSSGIGGPPGLPVNFAVVNEGTLQVDGGSLAVSYPVTNLGTIQATSGGTLSFATGALTNLAGGILSGGTYEADAGSVINLPGNIVTNAATIILNGAGASFPAMQYLAVNSGTLNIENGASFTTAANLTNSGTIDVGGPSETNSASSLTIVSAYTQNSGLTDVSGTLSVAGTATIAGGTLQIGNGGAGGVVIGNVVDNAAVNIDLAGSVAVANSFSGTGSMTISGPGTIMLAGSNTYTGGTSIGSGELLVNALGQLPTGGAILNDATLAIEVDATTPVVAGQITGSGTLQVGALGTPGFLQLQPAGVTDKQGSLFIAAGSTLDIENNTLLINYGSGPDPIASIQSEIASGSNGGLQSGFGIISSPVIAANSAAGGQQVYAIGYADSADGIVSSLSSGTIEIKATLIGDAQLAGAVTFGDFQILSQHFGHAGGWDEGDFNGSATVDFGNYQLLAQNFGKTSAIVAASLLNVQWTGAGDGKTWSNPANWSSDAVPNQYSNVTVPAGVASLTIGGGAFSVNSLSSGSTITITSGALSVFSASAFNAVALTVNAGATLQINSGGNFTGSIVNNGTLILNMANNAAFAASISGSGSVQFTGAGEVTMLGSNTYTGPTTVASGAVVIGASGALPAGAAVTIGGGAVLRLASGIGTQAVSSLTIEPGGTVDLTSNTLMIDFGAAADPIAAIRSYLTEGYNGGTWNGPGIDSSAVAGENASQSKLLYSIGYADGADGIVSGLTAGQIEIMPTLAGDARLTGTVAFGDFQTISQYFGRAGGWDEGNFTYGPTVDFGDFQLMSQDFGQTSALSAGEAILEGTFTPSSTQLFSDVAVE